MAIAPDAAADNEWRKHLVKTDEQTAEPAPAATRDQPLPHGTPPAEGRVVVEMVKATQMPAETVQAALQWLEHGDSIPASELAEIDADSSATTRAELTQMWGTSYAANVAAINVFLDALPPNAAFVIRNARDADGRAFANDPAVLQRLLGAARQHQPSSAAKDDVDGQIREIEATMRRDRAAYNRNGQLQARYLALLSAKHRG